MVYLCAFKILFNLHGLHKMVNFHVGATKNTGAN